MRNNWLVQGLIANWISSALVAGGAVVLAALGRFQSPWLYPVLSGLGGAAIILACVLMLRSLYGVRPGTVEPRIRFWLDQIGASTKVRPMEEAKFFYEVTFNGKLILVAQSIKDQKYIDLRANVTFVEEDNKRLATVPGGLDGVQRVMRLFLALMHIGYTGFEIPFKTLGVFRRLPITQDFSEEKFIDAFFSVEAALNLIGVVISTPPQEAKPPSQ